MLNLGELVIKVKVDDTDAKSGLRNIESTVSSSSSSMNKSFVKVGDIVKGVFSYKLIEKFGKALINLGKQSVELYGDFEQLQGGIEAIFGGVEEGAEQIARVQELGNQAWKNLTLSQNDYYEAFMSSYALVKNDIEDQNVAIERTNDLLQLCSDLSNRFGYEYTEASNAINWALKGSYARLDNLNIGIVGTKKGFLDAAHNCGYLVDSVDELTSDEKIDIITKYAEKYHVLGTTQKEAATTLQGSSKMLQAAWKNLLTAFGKGDPKELQESLEELGDAVVTYLNNLIPIVTTVAKSVGKVIIKGITGIDLSDTYASLSEKLTALLNKLAEELPELLPKLTEKLLEIYNSLLDELIEISENEESRQKLQEAGINLVKGLVIGIIKSKAIEKEAMPEIRKKILKYIVDRLKPDVEIGGGGVISSYIHGMYLLLEPKLQELSASIKEKWNTLNAACDKAWETIKTTIYNKMYELADKWGFLKFEKKIAQIDLKDELSPYLEPLKEKWAEFKKALKKPAKPEINGSLVDEFIWLIDKALIGWDKLKKALAAPIVAEVQYKTVQLVMNDVPWALETAVKRAAEKTYKHKHRGGLNFVPANNYPALLHYGEAVLSRGEANAYRNNDMTNINYKDLAAAMADLMPSTIVVQTTLDGRILASTTAPFMKKAIDRIDLADNRQLGLV